MQVSVLDNALEEEQKKLFRLSAVGLLRCRRSSCKTARRSHNGYSNSCKQ
jgi:hypothetical protein